MASHSIKSDIRSLTYDIATRAFAALSWFIPKNNHKILFFSAPDYSDNARTRTE